MRFQKVLSVVLALVIMAAPVLFVPATASAQTLPPNNKIAVVSKGEFSGMDLDDMFDFVTNMENDELWWNDVIDTQLVAGSLDGPFAGRKFIQQGSFGGFPYSTELNITGGAENVYMSLKGTSPFLTYSSAYVFYERANGNVVITSLSVIEGPGVTPELMDGAIHAAFINLAAYHDIELVSYQNLVGEYLN